MFRYFLLQLKRVCRLLPYVALAAVVLFGGLFLVLNSIVQSFSSEEANTKLRIGIVGEAENTYLEMGIAALRSVDSARYAIEVVEMRESEARTALEDGIIEAYVVIPEGFVDAALDGRVMTINYVSTVGARGLLSMFKDEVTKVIADVVLACQRGMYGIEGAYESINASGYGKHMNRLSVSYVELVLLRSKTYSTQEFGFRDQLGLEGYLFSGICVLFFALSVLPFGQLLIKRDLSLNRLLASRRCGSVLQTLIEHLAFLLGFVMVMLLTFILVAFGVEALKIDLRWLMGGVRWSTIWNLLPALIMIASFGFMLYSFLDNIVSGTLLQFFATIAMCFIGGCMYPISFFPDSARRLAQYLPHSLARDSVSDFLIGQVTIRTALLLIVYAIIFVSVAVACFSLRVRKAKR